MSWVTHDMRLVRIRRYVARAREAGLVAILRIAYSRLGGYVLYAPALWNRVALRLRPVPVFDASIDRTTEVADPQFCVLWNGRQLQSLKTALSHGAEHEQYGRRAMARAEAAIAGRISLLGWGSILVEMPPRWNSDIYRDVSWPTSFHKFIDVLRIGEVCDVKVPWELSRLQFLVWLGQAWLVSADVKYLREFWNLLRDWSLKNPVGYGVNWTCSMEVAIRGVNIAVAANLFGAAFVEAEKNWINRLLSQHLRHILLNLELSDVTGNHYLFDLVGVATLTQTLYGPNSAFARRARLWLLKECKSQFHADGVHIEHASGYHRLVTEALVFHAICSRSQGIEICAEFRGILQAATRFIGEIAVRDDEIPLIGDSDSGNLLLLGDSRGNSVAGLNQLAGFDSSLAKTLLAGGDPEQAIWLVGASGDAPEGIRRQRSPTPLQGEGMRLSAFPDGGYYVVRGNETLIIFRCGASGLRGRGSHDHNDQLSLVFFPFGKAMVTDPGTSNYTADVDAHTRDLATRRHGTVSINMLEQSPIQWGSVTSTVRCATARCESFSKIDNDFVEWVGVLPNYGVVSSGVTHQRRVEIAPMTNELIELCITDSVCSVRGDQLSCVATFPIHPAWRIGELKDRTVCLHFDGLQGRFDLETDGGLEAALDTVSLDYGASAIAPVIRIAFSGRGAAQLVTRLSCRRGH